MKFLLDTNVLSETRKGANAHPAVFAWWRKTAESDLYLSVLALAEIRRGIELLRPRDPDRSHQLEVWLQAVKAGFSNRLLPVDHITADAWGSLASQRSLPIMDSLMAATAIAYDLVLVTRNIKDMKGLGVKLLNPFETSH